MSSENQDRVHLSVCDDAQECDIIDFDAMLDPDSELRDDFVVIALPEFDDTDSHVVQPAIIGLLDVEGLVALFGEDPTRILAHQDSRKYRTVCYCRFCTWLKSHLLVW